MAIFKVCKKNKYEALNLVVLLQLLPILTQVWDDIIVDLICKLPKAMGHDTILVVVDRFTKYSHFLLLSHPNTTNSVAKLFVHEIVRLYGFA